MDNKSIFNTKNYNYHDQQRDVSQNYDIKHNNGHDDDSYNKLLSPDLRHVQRDMGAFVLKLLRSKDLIDDLRPDPLDDFSDIYQKADIKKDLDYLSDVERLRDGKEYSFNGSKIMEQSFTIALEQNDFFREGGLFEGENESVDDELIINQNDSYDKNHLSAKIQEDISKTNELITVPASEIDDNFNHFDLICAIKNKFTDFKPLPFAIDLTYNVNDIDLTNKFSHRHRYGLNEYGRRRTGNSEFGYTKYGRDEKGRITPYAVVGTSDQDSMGTKMEGFTSAKYFIDKNGAWDEPTLSKGRINIMPRFIIGYDKKDAITIMNGLPSKNIDTSKMSPKERILHKKMQQEQREEYHAAEHRILWSTLLEMQVQLMHLKKKVSKAIDHKDLTNSRTYGHLTLLEKAKVQEEQEIAKDQLEKLSTYLDHAISSVEKEAEQDPRLRYARYQVENSKIYKNIAYISDSVYDKGLTTRSLIKEGINMHSSFKNKSSKEAS